MNSAGESQESGLVQQLIMEARLGSQPSLGRMLESCRQYLLLVANQELRPELQGKVGASDLVQESFLEAQRDFAGFEGQTEAELLAWLRRILLRACGKINRFYVCLA
jgi:RNA polymerase sigma-70 factor, ECF subfamily